MRKEMGQLRMLMGGERERYAPKHAFLYICTCTRIKIHIHACIYTPALLQTKGRLEGDSFHLSSHQPLKINPQPEPR